MNRYMYILHQHNNALLRSKHYVCYFSGGFMVSRNRLKLLLYVASNSHK